MEVERYNLLNPDKPQRVSYVEQCFKKKEGPILAASDYMRSHSDQIRQYTKKKKLQTHMKKMENYIFHRKTKKQLSNIVNNS